MKIAADYLPGIINIRESEVFSLVIEHKELFLHVVQDLYLQISTGMEGELILSKNDKVIKPSKRVELVTSFIPFDLNEKRLISKINSILEERALDENNYHVTMSMLANIERFANHLSEDFPLTLVCNGITPAGLVKMFNISIEDDSSSNIERILNYMSIVNDLLGDKLFVFINMTLFFSDDDMQGFITTCNMHKYSVLLIDGIDCKRYDGISRLIIDKDLCTI
ncbi:MAG: type II-A CRISPR-associated protein Csn2 [Eubacterium sp.]|nr:type II-A CRISPR-associated protein Csn2 [Eubacterium sp.]